VKNIDAPIPELGNRSWAELEVVEHNDGTLLFSDKIRKRTKCGGIEEIPVRVRIARKSHLVNARAEARIWFGSIKGLDFDRDRDVFNELEQTCILAHAIRENTAPYGQLESPQDLFGKYDEASLSDLAGRVECLRNMIDPRESELNEDELFAKAFAVAKAGHLLPLTDIAGHEQPSCIVFMAFQALRSPKGVSWLQSHEISMLEPKVPTNSEQSSKVAD
jgi:hypothetical protein